MWRITKDVTDLLGEGLKVLKRHPDSRVVLRHNGVGPGVVGDVLDYLGIGYESAETDAVLEAARVEAKAAGVNCYGPDLTRIDLTGEPDLGRLREYWEHGPVPRTL
tara:strand:+ start:142 stop:459 length:318 start_codon:yes stop_codon:yes gene_type:complete